MSDPNEQFYMPGTEGSGEYIVLAASSFGRLGYRELPGGVVRVRLEPTPRKTAVIAAVLTRESGWKQPGDQGQERFSTVTDCDEAEDAIKTAFALIKRGRPLAYNPNAPKV